MYVHRYDQFLTKVQATAPTAGFRAVAIHPSSDVDLVEVGGHVLGVGSIVPLDPGTAAKFTAIRRPTGPLVFQGVGNRASQDKLEYPGEKLVLQFYEDCDPLVPPRQRNPVYRQVAIDGALMDVAAAASLLAFRLPFQGRTHARFWFYRDDDTRDFSITIVGLAYGYRDKPSAWAADEDATYTWWNGGGAAPVLSVAGISQARAIHIGGLGDDLEIFDELAVFAFGGGAGASDSVHIAGEADGES